MIKIIALCIGLTVWYFYYGLECILHGGGSRKLMRLKLLAEEISWILPGGESKKLKYCNGDKELADTLPGFFHFVFTHILIPFSPLIFVHILV